MNKPYFNNTSVPVGSVVAFAGNIVEGGKSEEHKTSVKELGWLVCDGRTLKTQEYPELYAALGNLYGSKISTDNKPSEFNIPDLRGMFLRGISGESDDAGKENRTKAEGGEETGVGSTQDFAVQKHVHVYTSPISGTLPPGPSAPVPVNNSTNPKDTTEAPTENVLAGKVKVSEYETRPSNTFVYYIIKYRY